MEFQRNKSLSDLNTFAIESTASHYFSANNLDEILSAIKKANALSLSVYILAGGSNVILESNIDGLVLQPKIMGINSEKCEAGVVKVTAGAGENWHKFVEYCVAQGWYGLENLALIPGDVGAAPIQNIGAYGVEIKDVFCQLEALNLETLQIEVFDLDACKFNYRDSVFKNEARNRFIILNVSFYLSTKSKAHASYPALRHWLESEAVLDPSSEDIFKAVVSIRQSKLPDPNLLPNCGSFFKNPIISTEKLHSIEKQFPEVVKFEVGGGCYKLAAAWLIDHAGWKGRWVEDIQVHQKHALVLTNPKKCSSENLYRAIEIIQKDIKQKFGVFLEVEPQAFGR